MLFIVEFMLTYSMYVYHKCQIDISRAFFVGLCCCLFVSFCSVFMAYLLYSIVNKQFRNITSQSCVCRLNKYQNFWIDSQTCLRPVVWCWRGTSCMFSTAHAAFDDWCWPGIALY